MRVMACNSRGVLKNGIKTGAMLVVALPQCKFCLSDCIEGQQKIIGPIDIFKAHWYVHQECAFWAPQVRALEVHFDWHT